MCIINVTQALIVCAAAFAVFIYYRHMAYKEFGGVTGDLAGYLLCVSELCMTMVAGVIALCM